MEDKTNGTPELRRTISPTLMRPRPMELGKIKIGGKGKEIETRSGAKMRLPVKLDHFLITTRKRGDDGNFEVDAYAHEKLGPTPEALPIRLRFASVEDNFQSEMLVYKGKTKVFSCDGETAINHKEKTSATCRRALGEECPCKPFGRLAVILEAASRYGGYHLFRTTSWETINNLQTTLRLFEAEFGSLRGLPLELVVYPATDTHDEGTSTSYKVGIVLRASYEEARTEALAFHKADQIERKELKALAAGMGAEIADNELEEEGDIAEEWVLDPYARKELEEIRVREEAKSATEARTEEIRRRLEESRKTAVDDGDVPPPEEEEEVDLPDFSEEEEPEHTGEFELVEGELDVGPLPVGFGQFKRKTWDEVLETSKGRGYVKHFVLGYDHPSLTDRVKDALRAKLETFEDEPESPEKGDGGEEGPSEPPESSEAPEDEGEPLEDGVDPQLGF